MSESKVSERIEQASREELERMACAVLREQARASLRKYRDVEVGMRELRQIMHLVDRLEEWADSSLTTSADVATLGEPLGRS